MRRGRAARPAGAAAMRKLGHDAHSRGSHGSPFVSDVRGGLGEFLWEMWWFRPSRPPRE